MPTMTSDGVIVVDKPAGITSQQAVSRLRRALGVKKAGHAGTLDPMATGVLLVGLGRATRLLGYLSGAGKSYQATIRLGQATTTDDREGAPVGEIADATCISDECITQAMAPLTGNISQVPSAVSAIKVSGQRAYAMVRAGLTPQLSARDVSVSRFEVLTRHDAAPFCDIDVVVDCSSGTYIRALARDLGAELGVGGHLTSLRRTRVGGFGIESAVPLDDVTWASLMPIAPVARTIFPCVDVDDATAGDVSHGRPLALLVPADPTAVFGPGGQFLALYRPQDDASAPVAVFVSGVVA